MTLKKILIIGIILSSNTAGAQSIKTLKVGDTLPKFKISKLFNSVTNSRYSTDHNNGLLIIDFWGTGCSVCVEQLPRMQDLQNKFGNSIKILPVTSEKQSSVAKFWTHNKHTKNLKLETVTDDKMFCKLFKFRIVPHEVWIHKGKIIAITSHEYVDELSIQNILKGENPDLPIKNDFYSYNPSRPLFKIDSNQVDVSKTILQYAAVCDYKDSVNSEGLSGGSGVIRDSVAKQIRTYFLNQPILNSYLIYLNKIYSSDTLIKPSMSFQANQILWKVSDPSNYRYSRANGYEHSWIMKNSICFESVYPNVGQTDQEIYLSVLKDLSRLFGLSVKWVRRTESVFVIRKNLRMQGKHAEIFSNDKYSLDYVCEKFNNVETNPYIFNESGDHTTPILIESKASWNDKVKIKNLLADSGFDLIEEQREVHKLLFEEKDAPRIVDGNVINEYNKRVNDSKKHELIKADENYDFLKNNGSKEDIITTSSGLQYKVLQEGNHRRLIKENKVLVNYEGSLVNRKIFDSTYAIGKPVELNIQNVIEGFREALLGMSEGSIWELYIPANLGYGSKTAGGRIPPNSTLIFKIELVKIIK